MNNEQNKPRELTEKELEGIVGGGLMVPKGEVWRLQQDPLQQELQKALQQGEDVIVVKSDKF